MSALDCTREQELLDALASSRWPGRCDAEMRAHVESCVVCRDTLTVALPLLMEGEAAYTAAQVPSSAIVWWRAQMRARREAERVASRPITIVQGIAFACGVLLVAAGAVWASPSLSPWGGWFRRLTGSVEMGTAAVTSAATLSPWGLLPWIALAVLVLVAPLAVYFAVTDD